MTSDQWNNEARAQLSERYKMLFKKNGRPICVVTIKLDEKALGVSLDHFSDVLKECLAETISELWDKARLMENPH